MKDSELLAIITAIIHAGRMQGLQAATEDVELSVLVAREIIKESK